MGLTRHEERLSSGIRVATLGHGNGTGLLQPPRRSSLSTLAPELPHLEFTGPDPVACEVSFVQADKLALGDVSKLLSLGYRDAIVLHPACDIPRGRLSVYQPAHQLADDLPQCGLMLEPERIGLAQRLAHGGITRRRTLIRPNEYIPQC